MGAGTVVRIGVTGHRTVDDPRMTAAAVDDVIERLAPPGTALVVLSALAEGADRLVAARARARRSGVLHAVLPLPAAEYVTDFATVASTAEFERLLAQAETVVVTGPGPDGSRESAYERAGRAIVDGCDVLLALWDGGGSRGRGGTAEIVAYANRREVAVEIVPTRRSQPA